MTAIYTSPLRIQKVENSRINEVDFNNIPFGRVFTDHMLVAEYKNGKWEDASIRPFGSLPLHPATTALHYGQAVFEGMKAYKTMDGEAVLFRPEENFNRLNKSARRLCMAEVPAEIFLDGLYKLIDLDRNWIPEKSGSSLYIRPVLFATDEYVGIKPSDNFLFVIFCSPVGAYYSEPLPVLIEEKYVRAAEGGVGAAKAAGNYAASLLPTKEAMEKGYKQLLWTDAKTHSFIEESGTMNVFFAINGSLLTPATDRDTILEGITRKSVIQLARDMGYSVEERAVSVAEIVEALRNGTLTDAFGAGTAATIAQLSAIGYRDEHFELPPVEDREISNALLERMSSIKTGRTEDPYGWLVRV